MADFKEKGNAAFSAGNYQEAIEHFTAGIEADPKNQVLYSNRSACYTNLGEYNKALEDAQKTIECKGDWARGYARKGTALHGLKRYKEAVDAYKEGLKHEPESEALKKGITDAEKAASEPQPPKLFDDSMWAKLAMNPKTRAYAQQPDFVNMIRTIQENPQSINMFLGDPRLQEALQVILSMTDFGGGSSGGGAGARARPAARGGGGDDEDEDEDATHWEEPPPQRASAPAPAPAPAAAKAAAPKAAPAPAPAAPKKDETDEERAARELKERATVEKDRGNTLYKAHDFPAAIEAYSRAAEIDPTDMTYLLNRSAVYFEMNDYEHCVDDCKRAVEIGRAAKADFKIIAKAFFRAGNAYGKQEKWAEAVDMFTKSNGESRSDETIKKLMHAKKAKDEAEKKAYLDPEKAEQAKNDGNDAFKRDDYPTAVTHYTEAIKRNPTNHVYYSNRAGAYTKLGAYPEALKDCDKCIELCPTFAKGYTRKAKLHHVMKEYWKCLDLYQTALELENNNEDALEGLQQTEMAIAEREQKGGEPDEETLNRAMADPEIQRLHSGDADVRAALQELQANPRAAGKLLSDPSVARKLMKLRAAGIVRFG